MTLRISKTVHAEIAHRLPAHPIPGNQRIHGHSLTVTVTAAGEPVGGVVQDFGILGAQVAAVVGLLDHQYLNEAHPEIDPPTLENIALWIARVMERTQPEGRSIVSVKVERPSCGEAAEWTP